VDVGVRLHDVVANAGGRYESPTEYSFRTDADGRFRSEQVPIGRATFWLTKAGYCRAGVGLPIVTPASNVELSMQEADLVEVTVVFKGGNRPDGYFVELAPEGGEAVGKWSGSGNIDANNHIAFENIPAGRYVLQVRPNPSSANEQSKPMTLELKGGETTAI